MPANFTLNQGGGFSLIPRWRLSVYDVVLGADSVDGQYPATDLRLNGTAGWSQQKLPSRTGPVSQWTANDADTLSFTTIFFNETFFDDVKPRVDRLWDWKKPLKSLGRPPRLLFESSGPDAFGAQGAAVEFIGVITSIDVTHSDPEPDGRIRRYDVSISLLEVADDVYGFRQLADPTKPPSLSRWRPVAEGETYETMADREYGDPRYGVFLRQDDGLAYPVPGDVVFLPDKSSYLGRPFAPQSHSLQYAEDSQAALSAILATHSGGLTRPVT